MIQPEFLNVSELISIHAIFVLILAVIILILLSIRIYRILPLFTLLKQLPDIGIKNTTYHLTSLPVYKILVSNNKIKQSYISKLNDIKYKKHVLTSNSELRGIIFQVVLQAMIGNRNAN